MHELPVTVYNPEGMSTVEIDVSDVDKISLRSDGFADIAEIVEEEREDI